MDASALLPDDPALRRLKLRRQWGHAIARQRETCRKTRQQLAEEVGVSEQAVGYWERGEIAPNPWNQTAIARSLGVAWSVLFQPESAS